MAYNDDQKTTRIGYLCWTMVALGLLLTITKGGCVQAASTSFMATDCKDEFVVLDEQHLTQTCKPGAKVEIVTSPPAPKPGILCHCPTKGESQDPTPAPTK